MPITASEYAAWANAAYAEERREAFLDEPHTLDEIKDVESPLQEFEEYGDETAKQKKKGKWRILETTKEYLVVRKIGTKDVVLAIKGSSNTGDFASSDVLIFAGALAVDPRLDPLRNIVRKYRKRGDNISVTGHSLGGSLAAELAKTEDVLGVVFNMGAGAGEISESTIEGEELRDARIENVIHFHLKLDVVSTGATVRNRYSTHYIDTDHDPLNAHFMHNFGDMKDEDYQAEINLRTKMIRKHQKEAADKGETIKGDVTIVEKGTRTIETVAEVFGTVVAAYGVVKAINAFPGRISSSLRAIFEKIRSAFSILRSAAAHAMSVLRSGGQGLSTLLHDLTNGVQRFVVYIKGLPAEVQSVVRTPESEPIFDDEFRNRLNKNRENFFDDDELEIDEYDDNGLLVEYEMEARPVEIDDIRDVKRSNVKIEIDDDDAFEEFDRMMAEEVDPNMKFDVGVLEEYDRLFDQQAVTDNLMNRLDDLFEDGDDGDDALEPDEPVNAGQQKDSGDVDFWADQRRREMNEKKNSVARDDVNQDDNELGDNYEGPDDDGGGDYQLMDEPVDMSEIGNGYQPLEDVPFVGEGMGESVVGDIGGDLAENLGGEMVSAISTEFVMGIIATTLDVLNVLGVLAIGIMYAVDIAQSIAQADEYVKEQALILAKSNEYDGRLSTLAKKANVGIPPLPAPYSMGRIYIYGRYDNPTIPWTFAELLGGIGTTYLEMRSNNPGIVYKPSGVYSGPEYANELSVLIKLAWDLHPRFPFEIGNMMVRDSYMRFFENTQDVHVQSFMKAHQKKARDSGVVWDNEDSEFSSTGTDYGFQAMSTSKFVKLYEEYSTWSRKTYIDKFTESYKSWLKDTHVKHNVDDKETADFMSDKLQFLKDQKGNPTYDKIVDGIENLNNLVTYVEDLVKSRQGVFPQNGLSVVLNAASSLRDAVITLLGYNLYGRGVDYNKQLGVMSEFIGKYDYNLLHKGFELVLSDPRVMSSYTVRGVDLGHFQTYLSIGSHGIMNTDVTTVADYNSKKALIDRQLILDNYDIKRYYSSGGKPMGDRETIEEFNHRFFTWRTQAASSDITDDNIVHITQPPVKASEHPDRWGVVIPTGNEFDRLMRARYGGVVVTPQSGVMCKDEPTTNKRKFSFVDTVQTNQSSWDMSTTI
jgi:hypothetical protein